jgi:hypothetical protein
MKSPRLTLAAAIVLLAAIAIFAASKLPAQTFTPAPQSAIAEVAVAESSTPASLWPDAPEPASSSSSLSSSSMSASAFIMPVPPRQPKRNLGAKTLGLFAWPGYGMLSDSRDEDEQGLKTMLAIERGTAFLDGASTYIMLDTPYLPNAIHATEADPLLTMFGNRNKAAILATGSFVEVLVNDGSVAIPRIFERKVGPHAGHIARIATILADGTLSMVHIQLSIFNLKNTARLMQSVNAAKANQPSGTQFGN